MDSEEILRKYVYEAMVSSTEELAKYAKEHHHFRTRTGLLERSVTAGHSEDGLTGWVKLDEDVAKYGPFVHQGTKPHIIEARIAKALRWFDADGRIHFAKRVHHPGYKGDPFLFRALDEKKDDIFKIFENRVEVAVREIVKGL